MQEKVIALATPVFFALIALELAWGWLRGRNTYRLDDAINSIGLGVLSQVSGVFTRLLRIGLYAWVFDYVSPWRLPADNAWIWAFALLAYDFCYYWKHRIGHERALFWAAHVVHHQSEDYNLSTALRQSSSDALLGWLFYLPMAAAGVPPEVFAVVALVDLLYQYWIHTQHIDRLGWFDRVFASPSNHRVHHAVNERYLNRNYGGILVVWDRMFGTFIDEDALDPPVYGTRRPLRSWNPLWANVEVYSWMLRDARHARGWRDRLRVVFGRTGWRPDGILDPAARKPFSLERPRFAPRIARRAQWYALLQFAALLAAAVHFLQWQAQAPTTWLVAYFAWIVLSLTTLGFVLEGRRIGAWLELGRNAATGVAIAASQRGFGIDDGSGFAVAALVVFCAAGAVWSAWIGGRDASEAALASTGAPTPSEPA